MEYLLVFICGRFLSCSGTARYAPTGNSHFERVTIYRDEEKSLLFAGLTRFLSPAAAGDSK